MKIYECHSVYVRAGVRTDPRRPSYSLATVFICGNGEEIMWSPREDIDNILSHADMVSHGLPRDIVVNCRINAETLDLLNDDPDVALDIASQLLADMYPDWSPMLGDNVQIVDHSCAWCNDPECTSDHDDDHRDGGPPPAEVGAWASALAPYQVRY